MPSNVWFVNIVVPNCHCSTIYPSLTLNETNDTPCYDIWKRFLDATSRCILKITNNCNFVPSIAIVTARVNLVDNAPPTMIDAVFSHVECTVRFGEQFKYTAVSFMLTRNRGLRIKPLYDIIKHRQKSCLTDCMVASVIWLSRVLVRTDRRRRFTNS